MIRRRDGASTRTDPRPGDHPPAADRVHLPVPCGPVPAIRPGARRRRPGEDTVSQQNAQRPAAAGTGPAPAAAVGPDTAPGPPDTAPGPPDTAASRAAPGTASQAGATGNRPPAATPAIPAAAARPGHRAPAARGAFSRPWVREIVVLACYVAAGIAATWPRAAYLTGRLP